MLLARFQAVNASRHARDKLANFKQDGSMRVYAQKMQELAMQVPGIQDDELLDRFTRGLKPRTRMEVVMREPQTFDEAVKLADRYDSLFMPGFGFSRQPSGSSTGGVLPVSFLSPSANPILPTPTPMEIDALRRRPAPLTAEERARLMQTGGCFYCCQPVTSLLTALLNPRRNHGSTRSRRPPPLRNPSPSTGTPSLGVWKTSRPSRWTRALYWRRPCFAHAREP
jgi:hypothetical protein